MPDRSRIVASQLAQRQLDDIIGRQGGTDPRRLSQIRGGLRRGVGQGGEGRGGAALSSIARLDAAEAGIQDRRVVSDLDLVGKTIVQPALANRRLDIQNLQAEVGLDAQRTQTRQTRARGIASIASMAANVRQAFANRQQQVAGTTPGAVATDQSGAQVDLYGNPV